VRERAGFDAFVAERAPRLLRAAHLLTHDWAAAEDLLQEAMTRAWFAWPRLEEPEPYVRRVIVTTYISQSRRRWRQELPLDRVDGTAGRGDPGRPTAPRSDPIQRADERDALWRALDRLPPRQRAVVVLRYYEDLPEAEVAGLLRCSVGTVKSQAAKALAKLRADASLAPAGATPGEGDQP